MDCPHPVSWKGYEPSIANADVFLVLAGVGEESVLALLADIWGYNITRRTQQNTGRPDNNSISLLELYANYREDGAMLPFILHPSCQSTNDFIEPALTTWRTSNNWTPDYWSEPDDILGSRTWNPLDKIFHPGTSHTIRNQLPDTLPALVSCMSVSCRLHNSICLQAGIT